MAFNPANLTVLRYVYPKTHWAYITTDNLADVLATDYFLNSGLAFRPWADFISITANDGKVVAEIWTSSDPLDLHVSTVKQVDVVNFYYPYV